MIDYGIYLITDSKIAKREDIPNIVEESIEGGCTIVQVREKSSSSLEFYKLAIKIREITKKHEVPLIINDRIDIALAVDADGVHLGQSDIPLKIAKKILPKDKIIGISASNLDDALKAEKDGADYLGVGAVFPTKTKKDTDYVSLDLLKEIKEKVSIPIVAIGGIKENNVKELENMDGVAIVSEIMGAKNPKEKTKAIYSLMH